LYLRRLEVNYSRTHEQAPWLQAGCRNRRYLGNHRRQDVGDNQVKLGIVVPQELPGVNQDQVYPRLRAVQPGVLCRRGDGLLVVVTGAHPRRAQLQTGDRKDAGAGTSVSADEAGANQPFQRLQAQSGGGMGPGAKSKARTDLDHHIAWRLFIFFPHRANNKPLTQPLPMKVFLPGRLPVSIGKFLDPNQAAAN